MKCELLLLLILCPDFLQSLCKCFPIGELGKWFHAREGSFTAANHVHKPSFLSMKRQDDNQAAEAMRSLVDFHEGQWRGVARSFSVTADVAAGIVQRKTSPPYTVSVRFGADQDRQDYILTETLSWGDHVSSRSLLLTKSNMDVDVEDASYSLDSSLPDFPSAISGTDKLKQFVIEHCIATTDDVRSRCLAFYGPDQSLLRIVVCEEHRIDESSTTATFSTDSQSQDATSKLSALDLMEMMGDVDRIVDKIASRIETGRTSSLDSDWRNANVIPPTDAPISRPGEYSLHSTSLMEVSSGLWLGDAVVRDNAAVATSSLDRSRADRPKITTEYNTPFASWSLGVQKVAWRWMWNFGEEIRQVNDAGKSMGSEMSAALSQTFSGIVCVNEGLSRRTPVGERMVYIDWSGDVVGFLVGPFSIQVPRFLNFDRNRQLRPFFTEFCVFQRTLSRDAKSPNTEDDDAEAAALPSLICSKQSRVYNPEGRLKQGCSSFFTFKRFGYNEDDRMA